MWIENLSGILAANLPSPVPEEAAGLCDRLCEIVAKKNDVMNLTSITAPSEMALLHIADSLFPADHIPRGAKLLDLGCGAGFPSLPLAAARPDLSVYPLDATGKKIAFVKETAAELGLKNVFPFAGRAEEEANKSGKREAFDVVISRAVAPLPVLCELALPFVAPGGVMIAMKGDRGGEEALLAEMARKKLGGGPFERIDYTLSGGGEVFCRTLLICRKEAPTPARYPRAYASIKKKPL